MMWWVVLLVFLLLIVGLLSVPFRLIIDSTKNVYELEWGRIVHLKITPVNRDLQLRLQFAQWKKDWSVIQQLVQSDDGAEKEEKSPKSAKRKDRFKRLNPSVIVGLLRTFRVRHWELNVDTGDYVKNAYLYPAFCFLNRAGGRWQVNYNGDFVFRTELDNRPFRMLWVFLVNAVRRK